MRKGWTATKLGDVVIRRTDFTPVDADKDYTILGVQRSGWGFVERERVQGSAQKFTKLMQVEQDDLVYRTITAFEAPSAVVGPAESGKFVTPQTFPVFRIDRARLLPAYMRLLTTWSVFHEAMASRCTGSVLRRKTLSISSFESIPVVLPPIEEQCRIVDLIAAVDSSILAAQDQADSASAAVGLMVETMAMNATGGVVTALKEHGTFTRGKRFTKAQYTDQGLPCVHYGQIYTTLGPVTSESLTYLPDDMKPKLRFADPGDVIVATTSENLEEVGKATLWSGDKPAAYHDDSYVYKHNLNPVFASYLFTTPEFHQRKRKYTAGLKVMRLSGASLESLELPIPDRAVQDQIAGVASALTASAAAAATYAGSLRNLRANLLTALLAGEHEIPETYDALLEATA